MKYDVDELGQKVLLQKTPYQVMMEWEKPYMEALINALNPSGDVLEIGFGMGYSATHIQTFHPKSHTIIECDPVVIQAARLWAANYPSVRIIEDTWQNALASLGTFDAIFFDDYPLDADPCSEWIEQKIPASNAIVQEGEQLLKKIKEELPELTRIRFSDADVDALCQHTPESKKEHLFHFLGELQTNGQITQDQYEKMCQTHHLIGIKKEPLPLFVCQDRTMDFLRLCLKSHMRKGSRFSAFSGSGTSKYEHSAFCNEIIANPHLDYREWTIPIEVPPSCRYYKDKEALVMVIEQMDEGTRP